MPKRVRTQAETVRKHVDIVHSSSRMTLREQHVSNALIRNAALQSRDEFREKKRHWILIGDICEDVFGARRNISALKRAMDGLLVKRVEWQYLTEHSRRTISASTWLAGYDIDAGVLYYSYSPQLVDLILDPHRWANLNYSIQRSITRSHTQSLYEQCARYRRLGHMREISLDTLRGLMGIKNHRSYQEFKSLNRSVIKPAVAEVNEKTELFIEPVFHKSQGTVSSISFNIRENPDYQGPRMRDGTRAESPFNTDEMEDRSGLYERLLVFGLTENRALSILGDYEDDYIVEILTLAGRRIRENKIRNLPGWVVRALEQDYRTTEPSPEVAGRTQQAALALEPDSAASSKRAEDQAHAESRLEDFETRILPRWRSERWLDQIATAERESVWREFEEQTTAKDSFSADLVANRPSSGFTQGIWRQYIRENHLGPHSEADMIACAAEHDIDLTSLRLQAGR